MDTKIIPLSKATAKLQAEVRELRSQLEKLTPQVAAVLDNDKGDLDALALKVGTLRAKADILENRLAKKRAELFSAVVADVIKAHEAAVDGYKNAQAELRSIEEGWRQAVREAHGTVAAEKIITDPLLKPIALQQAHFKLDAARAFVTDAEVARLRVDRAWHEANTGDAVQPEGQPGKFMPVEWYQKGAAEIAPELSVG